MSKHEMNEDEEFLEFGRFLACPPPGEEVVVSGIAGQFPECDHMYELRDNLLNGVDMVTEDERRWKKEDPRIPQRVGKIKDLSKFDCSFFGLHSKQANCMCPMLRSLMERTYEAIVDAGINPASLKGTRTGVYLGSCFSETEKAWIFESLQDNSYPLTGTSRPIFAARISHWLGVTGPCHTTDSACSSALFAVNHAYQDLRLGVVDYAIVGGSNLCLDPFTSLQFAGLGVLSADGRVKAFDQDADGYVRSEAMVIAFLQRAKDARRIYCTVVHSKVNCDGYKPEGITFPATQVHEMLFREFYQECGINPATVDYMEAHATGTKVGDPEELNAVERVFCKNRATPLPVGSNKSNLGHSEPASGLCSLGKVVLSMETGIIAANLNFKTHKEAVDGFKTGKFKVITENTPLPGGLVAINSFGFGGANAHLLLRHNAKKKEQGGAARDLLPRLVVASGRTEEAVQVIINSVQSTPADTEFISLLHEVHSMNTAGHCYRGYTLLLPGDESNTQIHFYDQKQRPVWLVSSGMGDQCLGIGRALLQVPTFAAAIQKCDHALRFKDINIMKVIASDGPNMADDFISLVVTATAIQLGLVDILTCVGITPDGLLGHSTGELVSAYADGCLTIQQAILVAYHYGAASSNSGHQELLKYLQQVISNPKPRSKRWVSPCMLGGDNNTSRSKLASPEYFTTCLPGSTPVECMASLLPDNALVIQLNPMEVLKPRTKNVTIFSLPPTPGNTAVDQLFAMLGKLYTAGVPLQLSQLYPAVQYPVSRGTAMISPLVRWEHSQSWAVYGEQQAMTKCERMVTINVADQGNEFYTGHVIDGRNLYPATGYLLLVWETFCQMFSSTAMTSVVFEDVRFLRATTLPPEGKVVFVISVQKKSGYFEVEDGGTAIVSGRIKRLKDSGHPAFLELPTPEPVEDQDHIDMEVRDIYKELRLRGYNYSGVFRGLRTVNFGATRGVISWYDNWVGFMDTMLQMRILARDSRSLFVPTGIDRMVIDVEKHVSQLAECGEDMTLPIYAWNNLDVVRSGGVEIHHMAASSITRRKPLGEPVLERYQFIPHTDFSESILSVQQALRLCVHLVLENHLGVKVQVMELCTPERELLARDLKSILEDLPLIEASVSVIVPQADSRVADLGPGVQVVKQSKLPADQSSLLVVAADIVHNTKLLDEAVQTLAEDGCVLTRELLSVDLNSIELNLQVIVDRAVAKERFLLLKKPRQRNTCSPQVVRVTEKDLSWLPVLQTAVRDVRDPQRVVLLAQDEPANGVVGLFNCIRKEPGGDLVRCFFILDPEAPQFKPYLPLYAKQLEKDLVVNVLQDGQWGSFRHLLLEPLPKTTAPHGYNNVLQRGDLSSLTWLEGPFTDMNDFKNPLHVYYSALNFRDIMMSTGKLSPDSITLDRIKMEVLQGFEFSGRDPRGARVMGMSNGCSLTNILENDTGLVWRVPDQWSLEEAATVPIVYSTVIYALKVEGRLERGDTVLIHAGSGGVGQAAINYCLFHGCTVYTTVGSQEKRDFIKKHFPQITDDHIGYSRDVSFEEFIMRETKQRGVDLVLNSLAEDKLQASIRCLAKRGRFLEIGKFDMANNNHIAMDMFFKDQSFHSVMLDLFFNAPRQEKIFLRNILQEAIEEGSVRPLGRTVFDVNNVEQAFRFMAAGRHIGKVLVKIRPEEGDMWVKPTLQPMVVKPRFHCDPQLTYVILGGLGGFGLELADWLVLRGARRLVLTSRRGISTGYQSSRVLTWRRYGVKVVISTADVSTEEGVTELLTEANAIGPVGGIFNLAVVLRDALLENQTEESFLESFRGKAQATRHLDIVSRRLCPRLKNFVVFSSVSCGRGNAGQTNYGMSNSIMERVCEARTRDGLPGLAIQWGAVGEVGLVAEMQEEQHELVIGGTLQQRISSCLEVMDHFLKQPHPVVASMVVAEKRASAGKFGNIIECVANILGIRDLKTVSVLSSLTELGMDSMMAVEVKQALEREFEVFLTPPEIRNLTIKQLQELSTTDNKEDALRAADEEQLQGSAEKAKQEQFIFNFYGSKEMATHILLPLTSSSSRKIVCPVFMVPGMEGTATTMEQLSKNVMAPCVGAQLCYHNTSNTIPDMASHLLKHIRKQLPPRKPFTLVGHSFGGLVALEMAVALEAEGSSGQVVLLDASPEFTYELVKQHILKDAKDEDSRQILLLYRILNFIAPTFEHSMDEFTAALKERSSLQERIEWVLEFAPEVDRGYQYAIVNAILTHINATVNYSWPQGRRVQSTVTLIRPTNTLIKMEGDCGLSKICQNKVAVHFVEGDHTSMLQNTATADIINQLLQG